MRAATRFYILAWIAALACCSLHCASQQPPGGGPRDLNPPIILHTAPQHGALNVRDRTIEITFDSYVDHRAAQDAFFISPAIAGKPEFAWSGRTLTITLPDSLRPNTTYIVSLGTDVVGVRESIHLAKPFTLPFSTGEILDSSSIAGRVYCDNPSGVFVFAYRIDNRSADTLNPTHTQPDFLAPVGKDSTYVIPALPYGIFRLIAIKDEQRNFVYDIGSDAYAAALSDVTIDAAHPLIHDIMFRLAPPEDTIPPELTGVDAITTTHLRANFSEPIDSTSLAITRFVLYDSIHQSPVIIRSVIPSRKRSSVEVFVNALTRETIYSSSVDSLRDVAGNRMRRGAATFTAAAVHDTVPPLVQWPMSDSTRDVAEPKFVFAFDKPLQRPLAEAGIMLSDSMHAQIALRFRWLNDATLAAYDDHQRDNQWYMLKINVQYFADLENNHTRDSVWRIHFRTRDNRTLGTLKGIIEDSTNAKHAGYYVSARNVNTKFVTMQHVSDAGAFTFDNLPDGTYMIDAFRDDDGNGICSSGSIVPYRFAEPFVAVYGTFRIRARWTVEGLRIVF